MKSLKELYLTHKAINEYFDLDHLRYVYVGMIIAEKLHKRTDTELESLYRYLLEEACEDYLNWNDVPNSDIYLELSAFIRGLDL